MMTSQGPWPIAKLRPFRGGKLVATLVTTTALATCLTLPGHAQSFDYSGVIITPINPATPGILTGTINILPDASVTTQFGGNHAIQPWAAGFANGAWTVNVDGSVRVLTPNSDIFGIWLRNGGNVAVNASGSVIGSNKGIVTAGAAGHVVNNGQIGGTSIGVHIENGGSVQNNAIIRGGVVFATSAISGTFINAGTVSSETLDSFGVIMNAGGTLNNSGSLSFKNIQVGFWSRNNMTFTNAGSLVATADSTYSPQVFGALLQNGTVNATNSGRIEGRDIGFRALSGPSATLTNSGTIKAHVLDAVRLESTGAATYRQSAGAVEGGRHGVYTNTAAPSTIEIRGGSVTGGLANAAGIGVTIVGAGNAAVTVSNATVSGTAAAIKGGTGAFDLRLNAGSTINGTVLLGSGPSTLTMQTGALVRGDIDAGAGGEMLTLTGAGSGSFDGAFRNFRNAKVDGGTWTLSGNSTFRDGLAINGGTLVGNGAITSTGSVTVAAGARLGGSGQLPSTVVNGTLAPGNSPGTLTVNGTLTMGAGSVYEAEIQGTASDRVNVTGKANLAGTLRLVWLGGPYSFTTPYTLLSAQSGLGGTRFGTLDSTATFGAGIATSLAYTANDVMLTLAPKPLTGFVASPLNAFSVAAGLDRAVAGGADPSALFGIYNLPAAAIPGAMNQLSGEAHTAAPAMAVSAADQFLRAMLDPFAAGRGSAGPAPGEASFSGLVRKGADLPAPAARLGSPAYTVWGAAFGSVGRTDGSARIGSAKRDLDDAHLAVGADFRIMPGTVAGFAVSGGNARSSLAGGLGKAEADVFQAGLYGTTRLGPVNLAAAFGYGRLENEIKRSIPVLGSALSSSYATTAWSGRLQASAAVLDWNGLALSPLAALQTIQARSPGLIEANWAGANAGALALARRNDITSRSELGLQLDYANSLNGLPVAGYLRASWAHYYQRDAALSASIAGLTGSGFAVEGARPARNSALLAAGLDLRLSPSVTLGARLDGELSGSTNRLGGQAQVRVSF